jgi:hypothetical protein
MIIFLSAVGCGVLFAWCGLLAQSGPKGPRGWRRWLMPAGIFAFCTLFGAAAFLIDSGNAETTLYEIEAEGSGSQVPVAVRFDVAVEHPGAEHDLLVAPLSDASVDRPAELQVQLTDPSGAVLLDDAVLLETRCEAFCEWDYYSELFTPRVLGVHTVVVTVLTPDVPVLHVRVGDPLKTDGERAPGY